jgi:small GTP-binding protein
VADDLILLCHDKEDKYFAKGLLNWLSKLGIANVRKFRKDLAPDAMVVIVLVPIVSTKLSELVEDLEIVRSHGKATIGVLMPESLKTNFEALSKYIDYIASDTAFSSITESLSKHLDPFFTIPPEIFIVHGRLPAYQSALQESPSRSLNETKLIVIGQASVGKTSLVNRILGKNYNSDESTTNGIAIHQWEVKVIKNEDLRLSADGLVILPKPSRDLHLAHDDTIIVDSEVNVRVNIWDFGGQEIMHATHQFFLTKRCLYLLIVDARMSQEENRVEYWLKIIQSLGSGAPVIIVGNKIDQHSFDIDGVGLKRKYKNIIGILETSAAANIGISDLILAIKSRMGLLPHIWDGLPEKWFRVKSELEKLGIEKNYVTHDDYLIVCDENDVTEEESKDTLIEVLHDLGVVLYFKDDPRLATLGILNPQWVTNGVYKILNSSALFKNKGVFSAIMLDEILSPPEYPRSKRLFILDIMRKFELCFDIEPEKLYLVPDLLPLEEPAELDFSGLSAFEYRYPLFPPGLITRFIVRMNQHIHDGLVWRTGVLLKVGENKALVKADIEDRKITIAIDGLEHTRRDALSAIRYQLDEIHNSIKGLDAQKRVPIPEAPNAEPLDYDYLLQLERDGDLEVLPVKDGGRLVKVNIRQLLSGIESEAQRRNQGGTVTNIYVGGNFDGNLIVGNSNQSIKDSYNKITSAKIDTDLKETLKQLAEAVAVVAQSLPAEQAAEATDDLSKLVEEATKPAPNKKWYSVSIEGLIKAAENVEKVGEPVINLSRKVLSLLTHNIGKQ